MKPMWKKKKFWAPIITGLVGAFAVVSEALFGIEIDVSTQAIIVGLSLSAMSVFLGLDWGETEK